MNVIIAGSRNMSVNMAEIHDLLSSYHVSSIISGGATGIDSCGEAYARQNNIELLVVPAEWDKFGRKAGPIRNSHMAYLGDLLLLIWDGKSKGSANMKKEMHKLGKPIIEVIKNG